MSGRRRLFATALALALRSPLGLALAAGVPALFLLAFKTVARGTRDYTEHLGMVLVITALGAGCFGFTAALVAERERGVWRRWRLLPVASGWFLAAALAAHLVLAAGSGALQLGLARLLGALPPDHPLQLALVLPLVLATFLAVGLLLAMLADGPGTAQAWGQAVFLPLIIIGGVGMPVGELPLWARHLASWLPGRYAVDLLRRCITGDGLAAGHWFAAPALAGFALAAALAAAALARWDPGPRRDPPRWALLGAALALWLAIGVAAEALGIPALRR